jgi:hypothetical protein
MARLRATAAATRSSRPRSANEDRRHGGLVVVRLEERFREIAVQPGGLLGVERDGRAVAADLRLQVAPAPREPGLEPQRPLLVRLRGSGRRGPHERGPYLGHE